MPKSRNGVFQRPDCAGFYVFYRDASGRRRREKAEGCYTLKQAQDYRAALATKAAQARALGITVNSEISTADLFTRYEQHQSGLKSWQRTKAILAKWRAVLPDQARQIARSHVDKFVAGRREQKAAPATLSKELTILKHCLRLAVEWGLLHTNPATGVRLPKVSTGRLRYLTPGEFKRLLNAAPRWMQATLALAAFTGCRRGELLGARWSDINLEARQLYLRSTKNGEPRYVPLNTLAVQVLASLPREDDLVLPGVDGPRLSVETKRLAKRLGMPDVSFHSLRHTAASWLVMQGADLYAVGQVLGHKTPRMTARYSHLSPQFMQATVERLNQKLLE